jgi:hypothetical protein
VAGVRAAKGDDQARGEEEGEGLEGAPGGGCEGVEGVWLWLRVGQLGCYLGLVKEGVHRRTPWLMAVLGVVL